MLLRDPAPTSTTMEIGPTRTASGDTVELAKVPRRAKRQGMVSSAVLNYIKTLRKLGHTKVNTSTIADALELPHREVLEAVRALNEKGVKPL